MPTNNMNSKQYKIIMYNECTDIPARQRKSSRARWHECTFPPIPLGKYKNLYVQSSVRVLYVRNPEALIEFVSPLFLKCQTQRNLSIFVPLVYAILLTKSYPTLWLIGFILLSDLITAEQSAFVSGRLIQDNILVVQKVLHQL